MADLSPVVARRAMAEYLGHPERVAHFSALLANKGIAAAEFCACVQTDAIRQPKLAEAITAAPDTLMDALSVCAASGLLPGNAHGQFYMIPRWSSKRSRTEVTFITGYKGLADVAYRHPRVFSVEAHLAFIGERFEYDPGSGEIVHKWNPDVKREELTDIFAAYAKVTLTTPNGQHVEGRPLVHVLTQKDILATKARSETGRKGFGPWVDDPLPMARKTPLRRLLGGGSVPRQYDLIHLLAQESQQEDIADPAPTSGHAGGVRGLKASLGVAPDRPPMPDDIAEQRALLRELAPTEDVDLLPDDEVSVRLSALTRPKE